MLSRLRHIGWLLRYAAYLLIVVVLFDTLALRLLFGFGYASHYDKEDLKRYPEPYVMFTGKPGALDHNALGFRGPTLQQADADSLTIVVFGGSTAYAGEPPIATNLGRRLAALTGAKIFVANYAVVSSNHRQHLHAMLEYLVEPTPDIVVFYGGFNETIQSAEYDPRPGYPYNYFYRAETAPALQVLVRYSAILGEIDKRYGWFTGIGRLRAREQPLSPQWNRRIVAKYFETLALARRLAASMPSAHCGKTGFAAFYQPFQVPDKFRDAHAEIRRRIAELPYVFDVSNAYDGLATDPYRDIVHVSQEARNLMADKIAGILARELSSGSLSRCRLPIGR